MNVNLTPNITGTKVNVTKGYSKADLDNSVATTKYYRDEAEAFKNTSSANATTTTTKANEASISATNALNSANTATTQAGIATNSANIILGSEAICISNAAIATSKALEASNSASSALDSKNSANTLASNASTSESNALSYKNSASSSASSAISSANTASIKADEASSSAITAINQATIATTKANEASNSAINASASEAVCIAKATIATDNADIAIAQAVIATNKATEANTSANTAITKASEASISANQALTYKNQLQEYVIPAGTSYSVDQINTQNSAMTKAQFNALAEERKANRAGSGFDEFGKHRITATEANINEGIWVNNTIANTFFLGRESETGSTGVSKELMAVSSINGIKNKLSSINDAVARAKISLPTAPTIYPHDTVLTTEQIASGVIKHADASNSGLIVNGKFDVDTSGWNAYNAIISRNTSGQLVVADSSGLAESQAYTSISTTIGKKYIIEFELISETTDSYVYTGNTIAGNNLLYSSPSIGRNVYEFTATANTTYIGVSSTGTGTSVYDNIAVYPADAISCSDLVFLESWHEDISEKNFVYPLGNVQYLGANTDGLTGIVNGNFTGFETYSLFGNFQTPSALIGKGYVWSSLTESQKKAFIANNDNNCYLDGDKVIQVRYRVRVLIGEDTNSMSKATVQGKAVVPSTVLFTAPVTTIDAGLYSNTSATYTYVGTSTNAISIANVHRKNQGISHPTYNPNGTKKASDNNFWYNTAISFTSISDCFDPAKLLTASGYIGTVSGRPDGLFYDQVHEGDILDLRNSSKKAEDYNRLIGREFNKLVAGSTRGKEGEKYTEFKTQTTTGTVSTVEVNDGTRYKSGNVIYIYDLTASSVKGRFVIKSISSNTLTVDVAFAKLANNYMISGASATATKSNTLLTCDVIGNPTNYPASWKIGTPFFTTLHTAEDGTSLLPDGVKDSFKLSRKANATPLLCLRSTDNGTTWTSFTPTFSTTTNEITLTNEPAGNLVMVYYQTHTSMAVPVANSEVVEYGKVLGTNGLANAHLVSTLIGKVATANTAPYLQMGYDINGYRIDTSTIKWSTTSTEIPVHSALSLGSGASGVATVKVLPYITRLNGKAYLNLVFKEMKHNGTSWGDSNTFNIVDNVSTTTDNNAQTILIGQKTVELPYFIGADE